LAKIIVQNYYNDQMETYFREEDEPMPYNENGSMLVREFRGSSDSNILWTTRAAMESWNGQRALWGSPINIGYAFKRPWEGGHSNQSQHYAGTAFDVAQGWTNEQRAALRASALASGLWVYVEPVSISPTWVHLDRRQLPPACLSGGYPLLQQGDVSVYVLILQDGLNVLGFGTGGLDGSFGDATRRSVIEFQMNNGLPADGIVGCGTWTALQAQVVGGGRGGVALD